ncbi:hypothetical protein NKH18_37175 [Streptomyces sp. M10(2022)]
MRKNRGTHRGPDLCAPGHRGTPTGREGGRPGPRGCQALSGTGPGELDRAAFEEIFPWRTGWASAVLAEGLLAPAGTGYRFAHEEFGDWIQGAHLDLDAALRALVHRWHTDEPLPAARVPVEDAHGAPGATPPPEPATCPYRATAPAR